MRSLRTHLERLEQKADRLVGDRPTESFPHFWRAINRDAEATELLCAAEEAFVGGDMEAFDALAQSLLDRAFSLPNEYWGPVTEPG